MLASGSAMSKPEEPFRLDQRGDHSPVKRDGTMSEGCGFRHRGVARRVVVLKNRGEHGYGDEHHKGRPPEGGDLPVRLGGWGLSRWCHRGDGRQAPKARSPAAWEGGSV
jgi:hypothetical protein